MKGAASVRESFRRQVRYFDGVDTAYASKIERIEMDRQGLEGWDDYDLGEFLGEREPDSTKDLTREFERLLGY